MWLFVPVVVLLVVLFFTFDHHLRKIQIPDVPSKYVLITGCDSGFGERACCKLDAIGCNVIAACLTEDGVARIERKCSGRVHPIAMDVTDESSVRSAVESVSKILPEGRGLWGLINNVGISGEIGPFEWFDKSVIARLFEVNVLGTVGVVQAFLPLIKKCGSGRIVNTTSILGRVSVPFAGPYCMTKFALEAFSDSLRVELHSSNIKVVIIEPGAHQTPFLDQIADNVHSAWEKLPDSRKQEYGENYLNKVLFLGTKFIPFFGSTDLNPVVDAYCRAVLSKWPRSRYTIGLDANLIHFTTFLPSVFADTLYLFAIWLSTFLK